MRDAKPSPKHVVANAGVVFVPNPVVKTEIQVLRYVRRFPPLAVPKEFALYTTNAPP
jgi:hypothetical protein